ncbi:MAG TPA: hypothetical protein VNX28_16135 [Gemmataceae bacterium]|jgi:hypothetical protein|nr:hypothetical protein [Gemmataceae bacterium]
MTQPSSNSPITPQELRELEREIRSVIQHDNELTNHRIQWFLTISGFLFTAVALYGNQPGRNWFGTAVGIIGLLTCVSFEVALKIGRNAWIRMTNLWDEYRARCKDPFIEVGVYGYKATDREGLFAPWRWLPHFVGFGWLLIILFVWSFRDLRPPGSFSPVVVKPAEQDVRIFDTTTGEKR